jgi:hypothetical protein
MILFRALLLLIPLFLGAKIAVVTLVVGDSYKKTMEIPLKNKVLYCEKFHYDLFVGDKRTHDREFFQWEKIKILSKIMEDTSYDWVFWTDADAMFMNFSIALEQFIDDDALLIISNDYNGLNNGHFLIKNCPESRAFMKNVWNRVDCIRGGNEEQVAMEKEIFENPLFSKKTKFIPQRMFNSFIKESFHHFNVCYEKGLYQPKDFIVHLAGLHDPFFLTEKFAFFEKQVESSHLDYLHFLSFYGQKNRVKNNPYVTGFIENQCPEIIGSTPEILQGVEEIYFLQKDLGVLASVIQPFLKETVSLYLRGIDSSSSIISDFFRFKKTKQTLKGFSCLEELGTLLKSKKKKLIFCPDERYFIKKFPFFEGSLKEGNLKIIFTSFNKKRELDLFFSKKNIPVKIYPLEKGEMYFVG